MHFRSMMFFPQGHLYYPRHLVLKKETKRSTHIHVHARICSLFAAPKELTANKDVPNITHGPQAPSPTN